MILTDQVKTSAWECSKTFQVDLNLILAIILQESGGKPFIARYEKNWGYFYKTKEFAKNLRITEDTEMIFQQTSWGLMQVMGSVARELGFIGQLPELTDTRLGVYNGTKKLSLLQAKYPNRFDLISSYNAGSPKKQATGYVNQSYVDSVTNIYNNIKAAK